MIPTCGCFSVVLGIQLSLIFIGPLFASELKHTYLTFLQGTQGEQHKACCNSLEMTQSTLYWFRNLAYTLKNDNCKEDKLFSVLSLGLAPFCFVLTQWKASLAREPRLEQEYECQDKLKKQNLVFMKESLLRLRTSTQPYYRGINTVQPLTLWTSHVLKLQLSVL